MNILYNRYHELIEELKQKRIMIRAILEIKKGKETMYGKHVLVYSGVEKEEIGRTVVEILFHTFITHYKNKTSGFIPTEGYIILREDLKTGIGDEVLRA